MKKNVKKYHYVIELVAVIIVAVIVSLTYESSQTVKNNVESTVNELTINYQEQLVTFNQHLNDFNRTAIGQPYVSDDKRYLVIDTVRSGIQDYDDIKTYLFDFREGKVIELEGNIAAWTGNSIWVLNYKNNIATWYTMVSGLPEFIASFNLTSEVAYHFVVSPNEQYTAISGGGISILGRDNTVLVINTNPEAMAYVWKDDNTTLVGTVPNPDRDILPEEEFYGPLDNLLVTFDRTNEAYTPYPENRELSSPRDLAWIKRDTSLLVNSGFDDGSFDEIFLPAEGIVNSIGETSGAIEGRFVDTKNNSFIVMGEFYPKDFDFNTNNTSTLELRIYNDKGILDYQYIFEDESFVNFLNVRREGNTIWFVARMPGETQRYQIGSLDMTENTVQFEPEIMSDTYIAFEILHGNQLLVQRETRLEIIPTKTPESKEKNLQ